MGERGRARVSEPTQQEEMTMSIRCSQGHDNPDGSAFCDECGEPLTTAMPVGASAPASAAPGVTTCPNCGAANRSGESFCTNCGAVLTKAPAAASAPSALASAAPVGVSRPRLVVASDNATFDLAGKSEVVIGREDPVSNIYPDVDLTPHRGEEDGVSRVHAKLLINGGQYLVEDENSTNHTFVNRQKLEPKVPTPIKDGDELKLGRVVLTFYAS
jgi:hypothetical protein